MTEVILTREAETEVLSLPEDKKNLLISTLKNLEHKDTWKLRDQSIQENIFVHNVDGYKVFFVQAENKRGEPALIVIKIASNSEIVSVRQPKYSISANKIEKESKKHLFQVVAVASDDKSPNLNEAHSQAIERSSPQTLTRRHSKLPSRANRSKYLLIVSAALLTSIFLLVCIAYKMPSLFRNDRTDEHSIPIRIK